MRTFIINITLLTMCHPDKCCSPQRAIVRE